MPLLPVIILIGGSSSRIHSFYEDENYPKALRKIGSKTLIELVLSNFIKYKFNNIILPLGYYKNDFINFFSNKKYLLGKKCNVYIHKKDFYRSEMLLQLKL